MKVLQLYVLHTIATLFLYVNVDTALKLDCITCLKQ